MKGSQERNEWVLESVIEADRQRIEELQRENRVKRYGKIAQNIYGAIVVLLGVLLLYISSSTPRPLMAAFISGLLFMSGISLILNSDKPDSMILAMFEENYEED